jgi:hypothetical protein
MKHFDREYRVPQRLKWRSWPIPSAPAQNHEHKPWRLWPENFSSVQKESVPNLLPSKESSHPELEDDSVIEWGLSRCGEEQDCGIVDFCEVKGGSVGKSFTTSLAEIRTFLVEMRIYIDLGSNCRQWG